jgi:hypothetical protein
MKPLSKIARQIAFGLGDDYDHAFVNKSEWNFHRGNKGFGYRDITSPYQGDFDDAAYNAVVAAHDEIADPVVKAALQSILNEGFS